jgi:hypothetical protein
MFDRKKMAQLKVIAFFPLLVAAVFLMDPGQQQHAHLFVL